MTPNGEGTRVGGGESSERSSGASYNVCSFATKPEAV